MRVQISLGAPFKTVIANYINKKLYCYLNCLVISGCSAVWLARPLWEKRFLFLRNEMLDITQRKGLLTETHCILDFTELGFRCLKAVDESAKYDIVVDIDGKFIKIQCKTASWTDDEHKAFSINTCCQTTNTKKTTRYKYSSDDVDYFYTWFNGQGYMVSINEATGSTFRWRYEYPATNQKQGIHIADKYKMEEIVKTI